MNGKIDFIVTKKYLKFCITKVKWAWAQQNYKIAQSDQS